MTSTITDRLAGISTSVAVKAPCRVASTANLTLSGLQTVDGVVLVADDFVLVKNQTASSANGIYYASATSWVRREDMDGARDIVKGTLVYVVEGTTQSDTFWQVDSANGIVIGADDLDFSLSSASNASQAAIAAAASATAASTSATSSATSATASATSASAAATSAAGFLLTKPCQGRLTLESNVPVQGQLTDVSSSTLYFTPFLGEAVAAYTGSVWTMLTLSQMSVAVPATANTNYDVFFDYNSGTPQLTLTVWTNNTTRAIGLVSLNGVLVLSGTNTKRYLGTIRTGSVSGAVPVSLLQCYLWNNYNRVIRTLQVQETTNTWTYSTASWQQANAATGNKVELVNGQSNSNVPTITPRLTAEVIGAFSGSATGQSAAVGIGVNSVLGAPTAMIMVPGKSTTAGIGNQALYARMEGQPPAIGYNYVAWLEMGNGSGTQTFYGDNGFTTNGTGLIVRTEF